jgi:predicted transcriptional regulator of viral defense system
MTKTLTRYLLSEFGGRAVTRDEIEAACKKFGAKYTNTVNFMISYGYLVRILRGLYYVKTFEEFKLGKAVDVRRIISLGLNRLGVSWYFGLHTALGLNGLTHEFPATTFVLNDSIFRPKEIEIAGERTRFLRLKRELFGFGVVDRDGVRFSDPEKTILDLVYLSRYRSLPKERIISTVGEYGEHLERGKLQGYLKFYPKTVEMVIRDAGLI